MDTTKGINGKGKNMSLNEIITSRPGRIFVRFQPDEYEEWTGWRMSTLREFDGDCFVCNICADTPEECISSWSWDHEFRRDPNQQ